MSGALINFEKYHRAVRSTDTIVPEGRINKVAGLVVEANGPAMGVGGICDIRTSSGILQAEVVGFDDQKVILMPLGELRDIQPGNAIVKRSGRPFVPMGDVFLGRVVDGLGNPIDGKGPIVGDTEHPLYGHRVNPLERKLITEKIDVGVSAINTMLTMGKGQRMAIMAGSGVGKSMLMGMMSRHTAADVSVIALIGERGREVKDFVEKNLGPQGLQRSVVVAATSDSPALVRIRGAHLATALADYFKDRGRDVLLMMDSVTRFAMALREVGLAAGEPPTSKGYTPSVFAHIPKLLERPGNFSGRGSVTGVYTVLVEGDDMNEPIADTVRSIVDGHIVLSRKLAHRGHFPAIDVLKSVSRVMNDIVDAAHHKASRELIEMIAVYRDAEDLIDIGAYTDGSDPRIDRAKRMMHRINQFLQQSPHAPAAMEKSLADMQALLKEAGR